MARPSLSSLAIAAILGSGCASSRPVEDPQDVGGPAPTARPGDPRPAGAPYEVHEWGLVRADVGDVLNTGAIAPPSYEPMIMDKPLLYFHAASPMELRRVSVHAPNGTILETWPAATGGEGDIAWMNVALGTAADCLVSPLPKRADPACARLPSDAECESTQLAIVRTEDAACVRSGETTERFLFYRARTDVFAPPLKLSRSADAVNVTIENEGSLPIPGMVVRIRNRDGIVHSTVAMPPAPRAKVVMGLDAVVDGELADDKAVDRKAAPASGAGPDAVRMTMAELGMSPAEIKAFMDAWSEALFMPNGYDGLRSPSDAILYFLPAQTIDTIAKLEFDPPPRAVKRAFAVWSAVDSFVPRRY